MAQSVILGIESSCDETCAAIVVDGRQLICDKIYSSAQLHARFGGVVPEIASRQHLLSVVAMIHQALEESQMSLADLSAIAVTAGPGLIGSLLVGVAAAKTLASVAAKPLVPVHHLAGHIAANYLAFPQLEPPFLALVISGAHSHLVAVDDYCRFRILARTRDDAPGESYDKLAREMGLPYPGGPGLDRLAQNGDPQAFALPRIHMADSLDFSFSGLKTASLNYLNQARQKAEKRGCALEEVLTLADLAASFQAAVADTLAEHSREALRQGRYRRLVLAGGVSANSGIRKRLEAMTEEEGAELFCPPIRYCTDNGAMIAAHGYYAYQAGQRADSTLNARAMWELA